MKRLAADGSYSVPALLTITLTKLAALVIAAASGFRGGRIFPAVFVGVALGLMLHQHVPQCRRRSPSPAPSWGWCWWSRATAGSACSWR